MRYCIISSPRSGSTWIEFVVFENLKYKNMKPGRLGEFLHPGVAKREQFVLSENNQIIPGKKERVSDQELVNDRMSMILNGDRNQSLTMRLFPQSYSFEFIDYIEFVKKLESCNFKFISLYRDIFSRAISWAVMDQTSIVHLIKENGRHYHTTVQGLKEKTKIDPITICPEKFTELLLRVHRDDIDRKIISSAVDAIELNYDTISHDIKQLGFVMYDTHMFPVHELPYTKLITNYDQLLDLYQKFKNTI
jgi:hypothetical protein